MEAYSNIAYTLLISLPRTVFLNFDCHKISWFTALIFCSAFALVIIILLWFDNTVVTRSDTMLNLDQIIEHLTSYYQVWHLVLHLTCTHNYAVLFIFGSARENWPYLNSTHSVVSLTATNKHFFFSSFSAPTFFVSWSVCIRPLVNDVPETNTPLLHLKKKKKKKKKKKN